MERLTNKYADLHSELKKELSTVSKKKEEECILHYSEISWFPGEQRSFSVIYDRLRNTLRAVRKSWDNNYDLKRFSSGVFNLDRLCIKENEVQFTKEQQKEFYLLMQSFSNFPETLEKSNYLMLDGIDYELIIKYGKIDKNYKWKVPTNDLQQFEPLIDMLLRCFQ